MAQVRKTRQQKIQLSQRRTEQAVIDESISQTGQAVSVHNGTILAEELAKPSLAVDNHIQATYLYAQEELRRIGWISLICVGLLLLAAVFLSQVPAFVQLREWLNLPNFSLL